MPDTFPDHQSSIPIDGRFTTNLRFADDIYLIDGTSSEFQDLTKRLYEEREQAAPLDTPTKCLVVFTLLYSYAPLAIYAVTEWRKHDWELKNLQKPFGDWLGVDTSLMQDCAPGHNRGRLPPSPREHKLEEQCKRSFLSISYSQQPTTT
ncbi:hypothetical protein DPMN_107985 [Dreissena polymorpha]|uniref:Uncharacterized protein n=1 Tax=Dreissena polymorpha TaxID=45954 RepID=A0A9D4K7S3_DREPO|nr:hypothetical protein DPMN_107985 [Dreissena polymorpha]